jgi:Polysaccharide lyase family 4, domain II
MHRIILSTAVLAAILAGLPVAAFSEYKASPVNNPSILAGKVDFKGTVPPPKVFKIEKNPEYCKNHPDSTPDGNRLLHEVRVNDGGLRDVVVTIEGIESGKPFTTPRADFKASHCQFTPYVSVGVKRGPYTVVNEDPIIHNPHLYEMIGGERKTLLTLPLPNFQSKIEKTLRIREGDVVKLECDQHNFMHNWIRIVDNPYYAKVNDKGEFEIDDIPDGTYKVTAWHPTLGILEKKITFSGGKQTADFVFTNQ